MAEFMVDAADWPEDGVAIPCGRALERPDTGSAFDEGHRARAAFFFWTWLLCSPLIDVGSPLVCGADIGGEGTADDRDEVEVVDEEF